MGAAMTLPDLGKWKQFKRHPLSEMFGDMDAELFEGFASDMARDGYDDKQPILLYEGQVLDGWQRHQAAIKKKLSRMPTFENYKGDDPLAEVIRRNNNRRHMTASQRAMAAAKLYTNVNFVNKFTTGDLTQDKCAQLLNVSRPLIVAAVKVLQGGTPDVQEAVVNGEVAVRDAAAVADKPPAVQNAALAEVQAEEPTPAAKKPRLKSGVRKPRAKKKTLHEAVTDDLAKEDDSAPKTIEDVIAAENSLLEKYARELGKLIDEMPETPWLVHDDRRKMAIGKGKDVCATVRTGKCYKACPMCKGQGCKHCHRSGRVTKYAYDQLV
jgi:hypothetical protein